jgi:Uma2 family endonuclease
MRHPRERFTIRLDRPATWDDLGEVPEGFIGEIVAGEIVATPRPANPHGDVTSDLEILLGAPFRTGIGGPGGWVIRHEPRIRFGEEIRVPDLAGWRRERYHSPVTGPMMVIPDWICEVLSPSTEADDRGPRMDLFRRAFVRHVWLIGWMARTLEVYRNDPAGWLRVATFTGDGRVRAEPFDAIELDLAQLWSLLPPPPPREE